MGIELRKRSSCETTSVEGDEGRCGDDDEEDENKDDALETRVEEASEFGEGARIGSGCL